MRWLENKWNSTTSSTEEPEFKVIGSIWGTWQEKEQITHLSEYIRKKPQNGKGNRKGTGQIREGYCEQAGGAPPPFPLNSGSIFWPQIPYLASISEHR